MALSPGSKKSLGTRYHCTKCKTAFYDLGKSIPRCPICNVIPFKSPKQKFQKNDAKLKSSSEIAFVNVVLGKVERIIPRSFALDDFKVRGDGWHVVASGQKKSRAASI